MNTSIFRDKSVCVVGNSKLNSCSVDVSADVYVFCNRLRPTPFITPIADDDPPYKKLQFVTFWDSCEEFDSKKHNFNLVSFVYIYALRNDARRLITHLYEQGISRSTYCPACRSEHGDNDQIEGIHWALPLTNRLQGRPFTGFLAIYKALIDGAKSITVTGFDFYRNANGWQTCVGPHNIENHIVWLNEMVKTEGSRIRLAPDVQTAMDDYFKWKAELKTV